MHRVFQAFHRPALPRLARVGALLLAVALSVPAAAQQVPYVTAQGGGGRFPLSAAGRSAPVHLAAEEHAGVVRAARDLAADIGTVTGAAPQLAVGERAAGREVVLIGTLGRNPVIDDLARRGRIDVRAVAGKWETFVLQVVDRPLPGVDRALVIAGSDRRGTIYGIYELSREIGVSPWAWWADVPVPRQAELHVARRPLTLGEPAVRYRGIFINDEAPALSGWARQTFGGFNHGFYEKVFELVLRLRGNYLWPAMWGSAFYADDPESARLAEEYGVVIGTSHHEPMMRAHDEWRRFGSGAWNYQTNDSTLRAFWREGVRRMGANESIVTLAMRGDGDEPMTQGTAISLLERIVADQRTILGEVTGRPLSEQPQVWALYKEVQDYYDQGMRVPDDVTLLFADDNWGNIRRLPSAADRARAGGFGVYYHFDYVGGPRNYKWINTTQVSRVWEQMHLAWRSGADRIWIVNVGDIKPMELPISFFLDYAWNPAAWPAERIPEWTRQWAAQQFGGEHAAAIARVLADYTRYNSRRKPELLDTATYSLAAYGEARRVVDEYAALAAEAERIEALLPAQARDAYFQLVLHPVLASANLHDLYVTAALNRLYARQGRAGTNALADRVRVLFERDAALSRRYEQETAGGKWAHMMAQTHIGYTYWQEPPRNVMPRVDVIHVPAAAEMGVAIEGSDRMWPAFGRDSALLPAMDAFNRQTRWIELFNRGAAPFDFTAAAGEAWVQVAPASGRVEAETRVTVSVDWDRAPAGLHRVPVTVTGADGRRAIVHAVVHNPETPRREQVRGFVEANGYVAMEAEHFTRAVEAGPVRWQRIPEIGRTLSGMMATPVTGESRTPGGNGAHLEYRMHLFTAGEVDVRAYFSPSLDTRGGEGLRYAVSMDGAEPQVVNAHADGSTRAGDRNAAWEQMVARNAIVSTSRHRVDAPGEHVLRVWVVDPGLVLQRIVVDTGGTQPSYLGPPESFRRRERVHPSLGG
jgi:hypothetical protein